MGVKAKAKTRRARAREREKAKTARRVRVKTKAKARVSPQRDMTAMAVARAKAKVLTTAMGAREKAKVLTTAMAAREKAKAHTIPATDPKESPVGEAGVAARARVATLVGRCPEKWAQEVKIWKWRTSIGCNAHAFRHYVASLRSCPASWVPIGSSVFTIVRCNSIIALIVF